MFLVVSALVLAAFLIPPFQLGAPVGMVVVLRLMHLVITAVAVGLALGAAGSAPA